MKPTSFGAAPPTLATSGEEEALKEKMQEIGESNRMTLKFQKPSA
jgi:hypothetical protein